MKLVPQLAVRHPFGSSANRRYFARYAAMVTVWRTLAALVLLGPPIALFVAQQEAHVDTSRTHTQNTIRRFAFEAFPQWAIAHHEELCPASLAELSPLINDEPTVDSWGTPLELRCGTGYRGAYVRSAGPDGRFETTDDISSND